MSRALSKSNKFPASKIKRIIQSNEDVGKINANVPLMLSKCLEILIQELVEETAKITSEKNSKTMSMAHFRELINSDPKFEFLKERVNNPK
jgi:histone H3/H4